MSVNLRDRILDSASALFYSQGIKSTGVDAVVKAAGTTKMSLYKYFPSKDELVLAYLRKRAVEARAWVDREVERRAEAPAEKLLAVFDSFGEFLASKDFRGCPFINALAEFAEEGGPVQLATTEFYGALHARLTDWAGQAGAVEPAVLARQLCLLIAGSVIAEQMQRQSGTMAVARLAAQSLIDNARKLP